MRQAPGIFFGNWLSVPKEIGIAEESLHFQITQCKIASFPAEATEKLPENRRKNRSNFWRPRKP